MAWHKDPNINNGTFVSAEDANNNKFGRTRAQAGLTIQLDSDHPVGSTNLILNIADGKFNIPAGYSYKAIVNKGGGNTEIIQYSNYLTNTPVGKSTLVLSSPTTVLHYSLEPVEEVNRYVYNAGGGNVIYYNDNSGILATDNNIYAECVSDFTQYTQIYNLVLKHSFDVNGTDCYIAMAYQYNSTQKNIEFYKYIDSVFYTIQGNLLISSPPGLQLFRFRISNATGANPVLAIDIDGVEVFSKTDSGTIPAGTNIGFSSHYAVSYYMERLSAGTWTP